jgi:nitroimidazol reductase NimA-like FMN-containing flavoprotein (pyridoxamine 5'-phosphate oxidase superfamily)
MIGKLSEEKMHEVLNENVLGRIGCTDGTNVYVVPVNYVFDGKFIIGHSLPGMKISMMRKHPQVCFEVDEMKSFTNWKSVIITAQYQELTEERERLAAMKLFVDRMLRLKLSETAVLPELAEQRVHPRSPGNIKPVIYRLIIEEMTGRFEND